MDMTQPEFRTIEIPVADYFSHGGLPVVCAWAVYRYVDRRYVKVGEVARAGTTRFLARGPSTTVIDLRARSRQAAVAAAELLNYWRTEETSHAD